MRKHFPFTLRKIVIFCLLFPMFMMSAFRAETIGTDTENYLRTYNYIADCNLLNAFVVSRMESGYVFLNYICSHFGISFLGMQVIINIFIYYSLSCFFFKYSPNIGLSCFLFLSLRMMFGPMNVVRMYIALAILLWAIPYIQKRKFCSFTIVCLIASSFHLAALLFWILYPLCVWKNKFKNYVIWSIAIAIALLGNLFFVKITSSIGIYEGYLNSQYFDGSIKVATYLSLVINLCFYLFILIANKSRLRMERGGGELSMLYVSSVSMKIILAIGLVGLTNSIMSRLSGFFDIFLLFLIPYSFYSLDNILKRYCLGFIMMILLVMQFLIVLMYRPNWNGVVPFEWGF